MRSNTVCASYRRPIFWALTRAGKQIPLDADPVPIGNVLLVGETESGTPLCRVGDYGGGDDLERYVSHFATCPDATRWRKRK